MSKVTLFDNYLFHCHALGKITGDSGGITEKQLEELGGLESKISRTPIQEARMKELLLKKYAEKKLPDTCTSYLKEIYYQVVKGFKKKIASKYLEKGHWNEEMGIDILASTILKNPRVPPIKNTEQKSNKYIIGSCDVDYGDVIIDIKNNYDWFGFENATLTKDYDQQLKGYMELWGKKEAILFYVLTNLPEHLMQDEENRLFYAGNFYVTKEDPAYIEACDKLREEYNFEKFPIEERFKAFKVEHDSEFYPKLKVRIDECRKWLNDYHQEQLDLYQSNKILMGLIEEPILNH